MTGSRTHPVDCDVVVLGGGIAALWTLDALDEAGFAGVLIEPAALGQGQTLASQGIIHGGLKYTLRGLLHASAEAVSAMPQRWRESLEGATRPDLRSVRVRSASTWMWRSETLSSKLAMLGARVGLRTQPIEVSAAERPAILRTAPGTVYRVDEPVLDTPSLVEAFRTRHLARMIRADGLEGIELRRIDTRHEVRVGDLTLRASALVLAAGSANEALRQTLSLQPAIMQRRPLHMVMMRGALPELHGHCVDGAATRLTITTSTDRAGRTVWQIGGRLAEAGVTLEPADLLQLAQRELREVLPDLDQRNVAWATYRIDRAERATHGGLRPDDAQCIVEGTPTSITLWPTKLALAPRGAELTVASLRTAGVRASGSIVIDGPRPAIGVAPWESATWTGAS